MHKPLAFAALVALLLGLAACGGASAADAISPSMAPMAPMAEPPPPPDRDYDGSLDSEDKMPTREPFGGGEAGMELAKAAPSPAPQPGAPGSPQPSPASGTAGQPSGEVASVRAPMLIYSAQITMAVFEVTASLAKVEALSRELGGFLSRRDDATITIRVPAARFDEAVKRIEGFGDMLHRNVAAEDVTEEFLDLEIRLRNARAVRDRLEKLLDKATKVEESVQLERELGRVASEIERIEGRLKYLRDRVSFSTITVSFEPRPSESIGNSAPRLPVYWLNELGLSRLLNL